MKNRQTKPKTPCLVDDATIKRYLLDGMHDAVDDIRFALLVGESDRELRDQHLYNALMRLREQGMFNNCEWAEDQYADHTKVR
jgi:hypothetical protein